MPFDPAVRSVFSIEDSSRPALRFTYGLWQPRANSYEIFKNVLDLLGSTLLLALSSPFILLGALLVKATSRGPAFYTQTRLGKHGRHFTIFKLRTMTHNCEKTSGAVW